MSYILTAKYTEDCSSGSGILGIYNSLDEAKAVMNIFLKRSRDETVEIIEVKKSLNIEDLNKIKEPSPDAEDVEEGFVEVDGKIYEGQGDYLGRNKSYGTIIETKQT